MRQTVDFLLFDWLGTDRLFTRERFADHSFETVSSVLDLCERMAREKFAPFNRLVDTEEPRFDGKRVHLPRATHDALQAYVPSGMMSAGQDAHMGGMQLPWVVEMAANAFFYKASVAISSYAMLTAANAHLLMAHGTPAQKEVFARNLLAGRWFGTMCMSEPQAGSSLADISTRAVPDADDFAADPLGPRYRLTGNKMWISGGDHELSENIVHRVLAKIPGDDGRPLAGTRGLSLFVVPKMLVDASGQLSGARNDVSLAGLNHKLGFRGTTNCLLNFGERDGAIAYRVGAPGEGLRIMFHMMNEARIRIGLAASMLGWAGYEASVDYARTRRQGRRQGPTSKDTAAPAVPIIEHADVRRMLLAQKAYVEGALALQLYCARFIDEIHTGEHERAEEAGLLLEVFEAGARLLLTSRTAADLEAAADGLRAQGIQADWVAADASDPEAIGDVVAQAMRRLGQVDVLVNNAGATWGAPAEDHPLEAWDKVMNLNVRGLFLFSQGVALSSMIPRRSGRIINVASIAGLGGNPPQVRTIAYNASKGAAVNFTRALAAEWGRFNITVNALAPGFSPAR